MKQTFKEKKQQLWWTSTGGKWRELFIRNCFNFWEYLGYYISEDVGQSLSLFVGSDQRQLLSHLIVSIPFTTM